MIDEIESSTVVVISLTGAIIIGDFMYWHSWGTVFWHLACVGLALLLAVPLLFLWSYSSYCSSKAVSFGDVLANADKKFSDNFSEIKNVQRRLDSVQENLEKLSLKLEKIAEHIKKSSPEVAKEEVKKAVDQAVAAPNWW